MSVTTTISPQTTTRARSLGLPHSQRPRTDETIAQGAAKAASSPRRVPPGLARSASPSCPRVRCAHEVVIPQEGQRLPNTVTKVQSGRPSCLCVPHPLASGTSTRAVISSPNRPSPRAASVKRRMLPSVTEPRGAVRNVAEAEEGWDNNDLPSSVQDGIMRSCWHGAGRGIGWTFRVTSDTGFHRGFLA